MGAKRKRHLVEAVSAKLDIGDVAATLAIDTVLEKIVELTGDGDMLILPRFGTFALRHRRASMTRNPQTGRPMPVPASTRLGFKQSKEKGDL